MIDEAAFIRRSTGLTADILGLLDVPEVCRALSSVWAAVINAALDAALRGGTTTIVDMPLNSIPPTTTTEALEIKRAAAAASAYVDIGFWGGAVPENLGALGPVHDAAG